MQTPFTSHITSKVHTRCKITAHKEVSRLYLILSFLILCIPCISCSTTHHRTDIDEGRGPIGYPVAPPLQQKPIGKIIKRNNIVRRIQFPDNSLVGIGSNSHSIYLNLDASDKEPFASHFIISQMWKTHGLIYMLSKYGEGVAINAQKKSFPFHINTTSLERGVTFTSARLLPHDQLALGTDHNTIVITSPVFPIPPHKIPVETSIALKNSPDKLIFLPDSTGQSRGKLYTLNYNESTLTEVDIEHNRRGIFQLAGNSIGSFAQINNTLVTTDPRKKALNVMTLDPLVTRIYANLGAVPRSVCAISDDTVAVSFPGENSIKMYSIATGIPHLLQTIPSIENITQLNCTDRSITADGDGKHHIPSTQLITLDPKSHLTLK